MYTLTEQDINNFLAFYRALFPEASNLPKMHILEDHVVPWFSQWHLGFGLMEEQGAVYPCAPYEDGEKFPRYS